MRNTSIIEHKMRTIYYKKAALRDLSLGDEPLFFLSELQSLIFQKIS